jgi:hypothetical protein
MNTAPTARQWEQIRQRVKNVIEGPNTDIDRFITDVAQHGQLSPALLAEYPVLVDTRRARLVEAVVRHALGGVDRADGEGNRACVVYDYPNDQLIGTVLDTGQTFTTDDPRQLADWLFAAGVRHGRVSMPDWREGDIAPFTGDKIALHHRLNQLGRQESGEQHEQMTTHQEYASLSPELTMQLYTDYPLIFPHRPPLAVADGWFDLLDTLCWRLQAETSNGGPQVVVQQVKEKFGGLRFYPKQQNDAQRGMIDMAQALSFRICEVCGDRGRHIGPGWERTRCAAHESDRGEYA